MDYVRCQEAEQLLELYPDMRGMIENVKLQMQNLLESSDISDDDILSLATKHSNAEDINVHSQGVVSDRTAKIAIEYESVLIDEKKAALKELRGELLLLEVTVNKIDVALSTLLVIQKDILIARHFEKLVFAEIAGKLLISASAAKQKRIEGLERFSRISRITIDEYEQIMKLFS